MKNNSNAADKKPLEKSDSYKIGKTTAVIERVFKDDNAKTLDKIILDLMKKDAKTH